MLVSNGTLRLLESRTGILGWLPALAEFQPAEEIELLPGDRLILYTDGLIEVFNSLNQMFGEPGLKDLVLQSAKLTLPEMQRAILDGVAAWRHGPLADDLTLVIVEVR
jgi:sigma-B regulation protein RsbU (phosphoserine phosphatase)